MTCVGGGVRVVCVFLLMRVIYVVCVMCARCTSNVIRERCILGMLCCVFVVCVCGVCVLRSAHDVCDV